MIVIGIIGLCLVGALWVMLYFYFVRRADRFMDAWERRIKEKAQQATKESLNSLEEATRAFEASLSGVESIHEAAQEIAISRKTLEEVALQRGLIPKPCAEETPPPKQIAEPELEPIPSPMASFEFVPYETRKRKDWEQWQSSRQLIPSCT